MASAQSFDAIVIGAGQAGPPLAGRLTAAGQTVAVIERKLVGGTCVNYGCIPTKTLVASAHAAHLARRGADFGVGTGEIDIDMAKVKARKDEVMLADRHGVEDWLQGMDGATLIRGHARFVDPHTVDVDGQLLRADRFFLNVGGRAVIPEFPGLDGVDYLTNVGILDLDELPGHLVIVGGSYIALEFAQMYRRFGARVTVIEKGPRLTSREDEDVSATIAEILRAEGIEVVLNATDIRFTKQDSGFEVTPRDGADPIEGTHLLLAVGRMPNTDDLGLENAGVDVDRHGYIVVDDQLRTTAQHIWAMGDCNGKGAFTHTSYNDFEIVAANLLDDDPRRVSDRVTTYALYIDPPLGRAGLTVDQVRKSGRKALVGKRPMTKVGRAVEKGETQGFMKVVVDAETEEILGAAILGVGGDEVVHSILDVMTAKLPYTAISRTMHIHPTVSELVPTMLQELKPLD
ncbi:FAD-containing oxidoreductase [Mycolicibacterium fortuitum]|uniref:Mercuric reductase n=1 Tax=Mycolicibacterium fortuitum subsp. fortuitum DSM 46621 = ATCC 6841 = JCM 6387 TaxID=1214102 RepID=K0VA88_MYCFO|nr:FAD-containing oxidoreductase [Mycolicibacterium fortuitum]AIY47093.1 PF00070 family, FAD-dependent NAD(P)-disulfide oxidoreductase [Mycobacterium sp. VKM Ac-1817D]CRL77030.1 mercuric reductase [Mycolicibacter nonchromogenicus]EJZ15947.1 mercuric reductase [Mycolicibacterium fortuitum subsp. fortuitum DSM 46621 = ATCC 6841 = JCM 6387]MDG5772195.1 FAD-containing oxidoreductase [Mycolicibacterium fortuitum]MDG5785368.1 FAD-containing oxidoreductase [Mycolicibacterium fortuitum]